MDCRICRDREIECDGRPNRCLNCERSQLECDGDYGATTAPTADWSNATTSEDGTYTSDQILHSEFSKVSSDGQQLSRETVTGAALAAAGHADHLRSDSKQLSHNDGSSADLANPRITRARVTDYRSFGFESKPEHPDNPTIHKTEKELTMEPAPPGKDSGHPASGDEFICRVSGCGKSFTRLSGLLSHETTHDKKRRVAKSISLRRDSSSRFSTSKQLYHGSNTESSSMGSERETKRRKQQDYAHELDSMKVGLRKGLLDKDFTSDRGMWQDTLTSDDRDHSHAAKNAFHEVLDSCVQNSSPDTPTSLSIEQVRILERAYGLLPGAVMRQEIPRLCRPKNFLVWTSELHEQKGNDKGSVHENLNDFLTISGSGNSFECCSCSAYVTKYWGPIVGYVALLLISSALKELLKGPTHVEGSVAIPDGKDRRVYYTATKSNLTLSFGCSFYDVDPMLEAVGWICSAVRQGTQGPGVSSSGEYEVSWMRQVRFLEKPARINAGSPRLKSFFFSELQLCSVHERNPTTARDSDAKCWLRLFKTIPVAHAILPMTWGRGLRIPFSLMVKLAAVENHCTIDGCTALVGYHTALIPTDEAEELDCVQWHFESVSPDQGMLQPEHLKESVGGNWLRLEAEDLPKKVCFLGWSRDANVMLGTRALVESSGHVQRSNLELSATHRERETVQAIFQISLGIPGINPVAQGGMTWKYTNDMIARPPTDDYRMALNNARNKTCLLVDSHTKQAWLIPMLSVVFHLCHLYYQHSKDTDEPTPIPYIRPSSNGARTVINAIKDSANLEVLGSSFSSIFHQQYHNLDQYPRYAKDNYFHANDLMDVLENKTTFPRKVVLKGNGYMWPDLLPFAKAVDSVGVCANIGQVLEPTSRLGDLPCRCQKFSCDKLPEHRSYLAAHVPSLKLLCWQHESSQYWRIGQTGASWVLQPDAWRFPRCSSKSIWADAAITHKILQKTCRDAFKSHKYWTWSRPEIAQTSVEKDFPSDGVVVFGRWQDRLELASK